MRGSVLRFDERFIEELKARLRPSDVIGRTVKLKRQGREFVGLSPFSKEKSPSFFVNDDKGFFHDFSSGKHGDIISFLQETERLSFVEAVSRLAGEAGMQLPAEDPHAAEREQKRQGWADWMDLAQKWFAANLRRNVGKAAREYLEKRGLPEDQWERFGLGYAPNDREGLKQALIHRGARPGDLVEAGLLIAPEGGGQPYDRFRDRLMFPILDARGRIVSFGGRAMNPDDRAKYLNGPETSLFHKGATLYGLPEARRILGAEKRGEQGIIVVEGYMDVIACQRAGVAAVAPMGTALTEEQMAVLWRTSAEPVLCFDGDAAGQRAAYRAIERALPLLKPERSFQFVTLSEGLDPDDLLREKGEAALRNAVKATTPFVKVLFQFLKSQLEPIDTPEKEAGLKARIRSSASIISDPDLSRAYKDYLTAAFYEDKRPSKSDREAAGRVIYRHRRAREARVFMDMTPEARSSLSSFRSLPKPFVAAVLNGLISYPDVALDQSESLLKHTLGDVDLDRLISDLVNLSFNSVVMSEGLIRSRLEAVGHDQILDRIDRIALRSHAPIQDIEISSDVAKLLLQKGVDALMQSRALSSAMEEMKSSASNFDSAAFADLKVKRDTLERLFASGEIWRIEEEIQGAQALH